MRRNLPFVIVGAVALVTLVSATMLYRAKRPAVLTISKEAASGSSGSIHVRGNPDAPVKLEEFGDFQCPPCGHLAGVIKQLEQDYHSRLRLVFHHFPLINHEHAREAAVAAEAAGLQGRFWEMHDVLYREQAIWSKTPNVRPLFESYAGMIGLDIDRFKKDVESDQTKSQVARDKEYGVKLGVTNTPTLFLNDRALEPSGTSPDALHAAVDAALKNPKPSSK